MIQTASYNMFKSAGGVSLPVEVSVQIVEDIVDDDPKAARVLMALSKGFYSLLKSFQHSIVKSVSVNDRVNYPAILLPSWPQNASIWGRSYPWLCEVRYRTYTIKSLINHTVTDMTNSSTVVALEMPAPDVPQIELSIRTERFKIEALRLMYGLADSTASLPSKDNCQVRMKQCWYLENLSATQLAILGTFSRILGMGYFSAAKASNPKKNDDLILERWMVFEDRVLRFGPYFAWATIIDNGEIRDWAQCVMRRGLIDMKAFETGHSMAYASLQSVVWKLFCNKAECDLYESWNAAKEIVEAEMAGYNI